MRNELDAVNYASICQAFLMRIVLSRQSLTDIEVRALTRDANRGIFVRSSEVHSASNSKDEVQREAYTCTVILTY